jgi:hypothetical protein
MMRWAVVGGAVAILVAAGAFEAVRAVRRADPESARRLQERLDAVPLAVGPWVGKPAEFDLRQLNQTGAVAHAFRVYTRPDSADEVQVLLLAGDPGDIGAHDPGRCYAGAGYRPVGGRARREVPDPAGPASSYWSARFDADTYPAVAVQVAWAWTADGTWTASDDARLDFVGRPALVKMYVTRRLGAADGAGDDDPAHRFLTEFVPAARTALAPR